MLPARVSLSFYNYRGFIPTNLTTPTECQLTIESTFAKGNEVTVGLDIGVTLADVIGAGVSSSVAVSEETGNSEAATLTCPEGDYWCALYIVPARTRVTGTVNKPARMEDQSCGFKDYPYEATFQRRGPNNVPADGVDVCACTNACGWANPGAPSRTCPGPCSGVIAGPGDVCPTV